MRSCLLKSWINEVFGECSKIQSMKKMWKSNLYQEREELNNLNFVSLIKVIFQLTYLSLRTYTLETLYDY